MMTYPTNPTGSGAVQKPATTAPTPPGDYAAAAAEPSSAPGTGPGRPGPKRPGPVAAVRQQDASGPPAGRTTVLKGAVARIVATAACEVPGVHRLGGGPSLTHGNHGGADRNDPARGVEVEVGERQAAVDLDVVTEYGFSIPRTVDALRAAVVTAVEQMTGLEVVEVNVRVTDVHLPQDDLPAAGETPRVI
ncbi:Asp23/Gls24 family envelope stress response protein [Kitasatospora sp. NPDC086009]|uniref:Asp23/Gls24 family envelope stress response protein n=1 Tax=unclassified Kitasatospora TaxID=2633591 RepID=UPI0037C59367